MRLASEQVQIIEKADGSLKGGGGAQRIWLGLHHGQVGSPADQKGATERRGRYSTRGAPRA